MHTFDDFFTLATKQAPYGYQRRLAGNGLPAVLQAPTGTGKTAAVVLGWLWRRLHGPDQQATPRRLIFALPQRTLVEQTAAAVQGWLANLGRTDEVPLHIVMGGSGFSQGAWRVDMHRPTIVVGTVDSLVSKALNRGYGVSRSIFPIDFALVTNGAHWVVDEVQLCPESTTTLRQLAGFAGSWPTAEPFGLTCMSATVPDQLLDTVDNPFPAGIDILRIEPDDRVGALARRLDAQRTVRRLPVDPGDHKAIAAAVRDRHRPGTLTLVVVNTVKTARAVFAALKDVPGARTLLHSRFRVLERASLLRRLIEEPGGDDHIVVSTQVVEAGVDINAAVLITEAAPWPSVVQRAGRCNRTGDLADAELWWLPPEKPAPYLDADVTATQAALTELEGQQVTGESLLSLPVETSDAQVSVVRRPDLLALFDTTPDLTGADIDIAPYVRDADDLDVQLAWAQWEPADSYGRPPADAKAPEPLLRCRVPLGELRALAKTKSVWRFDQAGARWEAVSDRAPARPGEVLVMAAKDGGYDVTTGFDPAAKATVPDAPPLEYRPDPAHGSDPSSGAEDAYRQDDASVSQRGWLSLQQHSDDARHQARFLLAAIRPVLDSATGEAIVTAAYLHDAGKSHPTWQDALCALASEPDAQQVAAGRPWAKSGIDGQLTFAGTAAFRHELASLLLLDGPLRGLLDGAVEPDLVRYLVLAHHGKLRLQVRGPDDVDEKTILGLRHGEVLVSPALLGGAGGEWTVDLDQFTLGGESSWTRTALRLRDRYGPFLLAYLETLVRIADWRASADPGIAAREPQETS